MGMECVRTIHEMQAWSRSAVIRRARLVLVPTMGYLHEGHLSLIRRARQEGDEVVVSLFVNPTQFGPNEDFNRYPRAFDRDRAACETEGVDVLFCPASEEMYAPNHSVHVDEPDVASILEGAFRPGHFRGVLTVVAKLFLAVCPDSAVFGRKDAQQLWLIRKMTQDLNFPVRIVEAPTVREPDGLAMSSRNAYLNDAVRKQATCLSRALSHGARLFQQGERNVYLLRKAMMDIVQAEPDADMDYVEVVDAATFSPLSLIREPAIALMAVRFGSVRLIDNTDLTETMVS